MDMTTYLLMRDRWGGGITPSGTISISANGSYNVEAFASAEVLVSGGGGNEDEIIERTIISIENNHVLSVGTCAFAYCSALTTVSFPAVTYIGTSAFAYCSALTTANFPAATDIGPSAFTNCKLLATASFPALTIIRSSVFVSCGSLTTVSFPVAHALDTGAFRNCSALTTVSFPAVTYIWASAFAYCSALTTVSFPAAISIQMYAFSGCYHLLSLYLLGSSRCTLANVNAFLSTPISNYTTSTGGVYGSIFVPASLYSSYISATNWATYSARFVSMTDEEIAALNI